MWFFFLTLIEVKTNIQNQEITDEPQTNGTYKIRQIVIKIMEYTFTYAPMSKVKTAQQK